MLGALSVVGPLLARLGGRPSGQLRAVVAAAATGRDGATTLAPFTWVAGRATVTAWDGAAMLRGLADASGILVVPEEGIGEGDTADSMVLPWSGFDAQLAAPGPMTVESRRG